VEFSRFQGPLEPFGVIGLRPHRNWSPYTTSLPTGGVRLKRAVSTSSSYGMSALCMQRKRQGPGAVTAKCLVLPLMWEAVDDLFSRLGAAAA